MELHVQEGSTVGKNSRNQDIRNSSSSASLWISKEQGNTDTHLLAGVIPSQHQQGLAGPPQTFPFPLGLSVGNLAVWWVESSNWDFPASCCLQALFCNRTLEKLLHSGTFLHKH